MAADSAIRDAQLVLRVTPAERAWFHHVARSHGITLSELVRQSVALEGARLGVPAPEPICSS